jgi:putative hydrolase of the HAD superfamily
VIRAVCFDVGNTLLMLDYAWLAAHFGRPEAAVRRAEAEVRQHGRWHRDGMAAYFPEIAERLGLPGAAGADVLAEHARRPEGLWCVPDPDAVAVLAELRARGFRLGVISNADGRVRDQLARAGLARWFEVVVDSAEAGVQKPDPAIFRLAARRLGLADRAVLYVGDIRDVDVAGAEAAGMAAIWRSPDMRLSAILDDERLRGCVDST